MSLFDDASLVMIPSAYKDGKLYSIKPTDGSGDFTFSRGSNLAATRVDVNGLIEKGRENLLLQSNQFDTTWTTSDTSVTSGQSGYDGSSDAWLLTATSTSNCRINQSISGSGVQTLSVYAKANTADFLAFNPIVGGTNPIAYFDLSNGTVGTTNSAVIDTGIISIGSGWYKCSITFNDTNTQMRILVVDADNSTAVTSGNSIYIQNAQLEQGLVATDYIETTTTTAQAGILEDMPRLDYSGGASCPSLLLEPQRTNAVVSSEYFQDNSWVELDAIVTSNEAISPEGLQNASKLLALSGLANHQIDGTNISISSGAVTGSVFAKKGANADWLRLRLSGTSNTPRAWFDLENGVVGDVDISGTATIEDYGNGWYRCSLTEAGNTASGGGGRLQMFINESDGQTQFTSNGDEYHYIYGAQLEQGSYPTSYIPTYGTSQTRSGDNHQLNITSIIESSSFTWFFYLGDWVGSAGNSGTYELLNTGSTRIQLRVRSDGYRMYYQNTNGGSSYPVAGSQTANKFCIAYDGFDYRLFIDGTLVNTYPSIGDTNWYLLTNVAGSGVNETLIIKQEVLFPTALTDSECIALTTL